MSVKHIDPKEFQQLGFLQEANRLFFHPHGLALEMTLVDGEGDSPTRDKIKAVLEQWQEDHGPEELHTDALASLIADALYPPGSQRISGCWDSRHDPEGIVFGSGGYGDSAERAANVQAEREKHTAARRALFGGDSDIEPLDYMYEGA